MAYTEFDGDLDGEEPGYVEFSGELDKPESKLDKVKSVVSKGVDAGLSMLTPKRSIADQAVSTPAAKLSPTQSKAGRIAVAKALVSGEPVPDEGGFINSAARTVGQNIKGAGQLGADYLGADQNNAVKQYGQAVIDANPTAVNSLEDIAAKPGTAVTEATGNAAPSMAGMVGARAIGQGITALSPLAGPAAPLVAAAGQVVSWLGPAAIAALPSYGGIREKQILNDPKNEKDGKAIAIATMGAAAVGTIEQAFGPQQWALAAMTKEGRVQLAKKFAATSLPGAIGKGVVKGAAIEGAEELAQNPIEQLASFDNPTTPENLKETAFGSAMGAIGGGVLGGGTGMILGKPVTELSDGTLRYTAQRGGKKSKGIAQAELDRRAKEGVDPAVANAEESTTEAVDRIISTGKDKAADINKDAPAASDSIQDGIFDDAPTPEPVETLNAQLNALAEGRKPGVLFTPGETIPDTLPEGVKSADVPGRGTLLYRDDATLEAALKGQMGTALGYGIDEKPAGATHAITARDENGTVIQDVATDGRQGVVQAATVAAGAKGTVEVRPIKNAMAERKAKVKAETPVTPTPVKVKDIGEIKKARVIQPKPEPKPVKTLPEKKSILPVPGNRTKEPWEMTAEEWRKATDNLRPETAQSNFTKGSASQAIARSKEGERLRYSVTNDASAKISAAQRGEIKLSKEELEALTDRLETKVSHKDVIEKALKEGKPVPPEVLEKYPDLAPTPKVQGTGVAAPTSDIRPLVESLIKRRAVASQIGRSRSFDKALADAKDMMAGKEVKPARFKNAADLMNADKPTADILMQLHDKAKAGRQASKVLATAAIPEPAPAKPASEPKSKGPSDKQIAQRAKLAKEAKERKSINGSDTLNQAIIKLGGIHDSLRNDLISDKKGNQKLSFVGSLFNPRGAQDLSNLANQLVSHGYFTEQEADSVDGGAALLAERLRAEYMGAESHRAFGAESESDYEKQVQDHYEQLEHDAQQKAELLGVEFDGIAKPEDLEINDEPVTPENLVNAELIAKAITIDPAGVDEIISSMGLAEGETTPEFMESIAQIIKDSENEGSQVIEDREADIEAHGTDQSASEEDIFGLESQTEKELKSAAEAKEKADQEAKKKSNTEEKEHKKAANDAAIKDKAKTSADNFVLGGNAIDEISGQGGMFSRSSADIKQTRSNVESVVKAIRAKWKNAPAVVILDSMDDAPAEAKAENDRQLSKGATGEPEGFISGGKVYIVASQMNSPDDVRRVLLHESIGHFGLRGVFGQDLQKILRQIYLLRRRDVAAKAKQYGFDINNKEDQEKAAEEVLAEMAQTNPQNSFVKRAVAAIRSWLRENIPGFENINLSDAEIIQNYLIPAREFIESGTRRGYGKGTRFSYVWHGTPHTWAPEPGFPHGRPRMDKMGSGESAQAFGWGFYSAENKGVASSYKEKLSPDTITRIQNDVYEIAGDQQHILTIYSADGKKNKTSYLAPNELSKWVGNDAAKMLIEKGDGDYKGLNIDFGNLYHLDIPDAVTPYLLDWDKPLSEQPEIHSRIDDAVRATGDINLIKWFERLPADVTGGDVYQELSQHTEDKKTSELLSSVGIVGNRYLDGQSRSDGKGTHNFVIWDQPTLDKVALLKRNGEVLDAIRERAASAVPDSGIRFSRSGQPESGSDLSKAANKAVKESADKNRRFREEHITFWNKSKKWLQRQLTPGGLLPKSVFAEKMDRDNELAAIEFDVAPLVWKLEKAIKADYGKNAIDLDAKIQTLLSEVMAGKIDRNVPDNTKTALIGMRQYIDNLSMRYVNALREQAIEQVAMAQLTGDQKLMAAAEENAHLQVTIMGNLGEYVHRSYRAFDDPNWAKKIPDNVINDARQYLINRNLETLGKQEAERKAEIILNEIVKHGTAYDSMAAFIKESKLGSKDISILKTRKAIAPEIRALLGEYADPRIGFAKSATKMGRLIFNQKFLENIRKAGYGNFLFTDETKPPEATAKIAADSSEVMSPLNGLWVTPEVDQAFKDALGKEHMEDWYRRIVQINGMVKYGKTVLSPTTAARNWMSAFFFAVANGHFDMRHMAKSVSGMKEYFSHGGDAEKMAYLRELKQLGVIYDTPYAGEMMRLLADTNIADTLILGKKKLNIKGAFNMATKFYQYGDDFWKIIGFENEKRMWMNTGMSEQDAKVKAAERIRNTYPTYSMVGRGIQQLRRFPLAGTFVSFPAEIVRTSANMLKYLAEDYKNPKTRSMAVRRGVGLAIASSFAFAAQALSMAMLGFDDDDDEAVRKMAAPWQRNSNLLYTGRDTNGNIRYMDLSFLDPYNYWKRPIMAVLRDQPADDSLRDIFKETLTPFFGADILAGTLFEVMANKKETGSPIFKSHDSPVNQVVDMANHIRKTAQPGIINNMERTYKALEGEVSRSGKKYNTQDEAAAWFGFRVSTLDPKVSLFYRSFDFKDAKAESEKKLRDVVLNPNSIGADKLRDTYEETIKMREKAYGDMTQLSIAAMRSGMTRGEVIGTLRNGGLSVPDAVLIVNGKVPQWRIPQNAGKHATKARISLGAEAGKRVMERYRELATVAAE